MSPHHSITHGDEATHLEIIGILPQLGLALPFAIVFVLYVIAIVRSNRWYKPWPRYRTVCWTIGVVLAIFSVMGPLARLAHMNFTAHMIGHLLFGMLAPLLMAFGAPIKLMLRTLRIPTARKVSKLLKSSPSRLLTNPIVSSILNIGGLWLLYTTSLYFLMHENILLHLIVHFHVFIAGYLFTISVIYIDPRPHRLSFWYRSIVLVFALAGHGILSKYIYAHPPIGVSIEQAKSGAILMYYGGDAIDIVLIFILCLHWFRASRPNGLATS
ncbi:cytochrome c oxidase assembly protein [Alkalihalobacillus hwajinpoensis]|uniref:cytochrome c oxidase assembly protein n=1 Tax=Guptibacillus hwajinpoensis TaxID=208199 RepID=UPI0018841B48|nr:cytochrome c oxidase assembly protein [Pseudalkalibacillus hwajinpoensis]MBF0706068.1 cytochrome c oxidase assembly protein [Pseudalkalibacillus hwajinpoensis]